MSITIRLTSLLPAMLLLAACAQAPRVAEGGATPTLASPTAAAANLGEAAEAEERQNPLPTPTPARLLPTPTPEPAPTPTSAPEAPPPPAFTEYLRATDPATVQIGSGKPQFVEFFAFW